ncbi:MAG TPA: SPOR domain-containing protein [Candidatus Polarisedimenticolia bacterium]|nr:SPOR domain-containing protein [Candidatus Polarisedimenticolia bacterium]
MARRVRGPILAVLVTSGLLLAGARFVGRVAASRASAGRGSDSGSVQKAAALDLTFYSRLGDAPAAKGPAPESALRPAPGDMVPASGIFVVQVLGSADETQAKRVRDRLASRGFPAAAIQDDGGTWKVRVGRWKERGPADVMADRIRKTTGLQTWVLREGER